MKTIRFCLCLAFLSLAFTWSLPAQEKDKSAEADVAWQEFKKASRPKPFPQEWTDNLPAQEVIQAEYLKRSYDALKAADLAKDFYSRFPGHEHSGEAKEQEYKLVDVAVRLGNTNVVNRLTEIKKTLAYSKDITEEMQVQFRLDLARQGAAEKLSEGMSAYLDDFEKRIRLVMKDYPTRLEPFNMLTQIAIGAVENGDVDRAKRLAAEIEESKLNEVAKKLVRTKLKRFELIGKPFEFNAASLDGKEISMKNLRGKVVMLDFWATWCASCINAMPEIKELYAKYQSQGFEVIGVNQDEERETMNKTLKNLSLPWPQHFDAGNAKGTWASKLGISGLPAIWLIDKKGVLRYVNGQENLADKVRILMAEPAP